MAGAGVVRALARRAPEPALRRARWVVERLPVPARRRLPGGRPLVSVVVPVYQVESYLTECLDSILSQDLRSLEVVVVDDGSTDGSSAIARDYARRDRRVRVIRQPNAGLGAARNTGIRHAIGRYLMFVDSDDRLPSGAVRRLVRSCEVSGSDLAVGSVVRFNARGTWTPDWVAVCHATERDGITIGDLPELVRNNYSWGKVYRRSFWDRCGLWFREGVAYEDQPIITQLYLRARGIDVLTDTVYEYRYRADSSSISQQINTVRDLRDRADAWLVSRDVLKDEAPQPVYLAWLQTLFSTHFHWYLDNESVQDDEYWTVLHGTLAVLASDVPDQVWRQTPPARRVTVELARRGLRDELLEFRRQEGRRTERFPATARTDGVLLHLPLQGPDGPGLDDELFLLRPEQLVTRHQIRRLRWVDDAAHADEPPRLRLEGYAFIAHLDLRRHRTEVTITLVDKDGVPGTAVPVTFSDDPALYPPGDADHAEYAAAAFVVDLPMQEVTASSPGKGFTLDVAVRTAGFATSATVTAVAGTGSAGLLETGVDAAGRQLQLAHPPRRPLRVMRQPARPVVVSATLSGRTIRGTVQPVPGRPLGRLFAITPLTDVHVPGIVGEVRADGTQDFEILLPPLPEAPGLDPVQRRWALRATSGRRRPTPLACPPREELADLQQDDGTVVALERTRRGNLGLIEWRAVAVVETARVSEEGRLLVEGTVCGVPGDLVLRVAGAIGRTAPVVAHREEQRFSAAIPLSAVRGRFGELPLPAGKYWLEAPDTTPQGTAVVLARGFARSTPRAFEAKLLSGRLTRTPWGRLEVVLLTPRDESERSRASQTALAEWSATLLPERFEGLLVRSYFGESATDAGVSVQRELRSRGADLPVRWAVKDHSVPVPPGAEAVMHGSREWYRLLRTSRYYIENMFQPIYHDKPPGQVLVQTFHGYPFKLMGHTYWESAGFSRALVSSYDARAAQWDYLVSPAPYATPLLRREFRYAGEVLEIGYPRNDALLAPEADAVRATVRASLGIDDGQVVVLYAPTFRDATARRNHQAQLIDLLGVDALAAELGDGYVVLNRSHAFNARTGERIGSRANLLDVTDYPEVSDLHLAADVAVVDYSSIRFDFGVTGKPMVFYVPDLEEYRAARGWLIDYEPTAPGPLVSTRAELVAALTRLDDVRAAHAQEYADFRRTYLSLEDGRAGARFVDAVLVPRGDAPSAATSP